MSRRSLDSDRPIMAPSLLSSKRASNRYSTYSASPSFSSTTSTLPSGSDLTPQTRQQAQGMQEIKNLTRGLDRLENKPLSQQRFVPTEAKSDTLSKLALGAKLERALGRRMTNQDAIYTPRARVDAEKRKAIVNAQITALPFVNEKMTYMRV